MCESKTMVLAPPKNSWSNRKEDMKKCSAHSTVRAAGEASPGGCGAKKGNLFPWGRKGS